MRVLSTFVCLCALTALVGALDVEAKSIPSSTPSSVSLHKLKNLVRVSTFSFSPCEEKCSATYQFMMAECHMGPSGPILQKCETRQYVIYENCLNTCQGSPSYPSSASKALSDHESDCEMQYQAQLAACGSTDDSCRNHAMEVYIMCQGWKQAASKASTSPARVPTSAHLASPASPTPSPCVQKCDAADESMFERCIQLEPWAGPNANYTAYARCIAEERSEYSACLVQCGESQKPSAAASMVKKTPQVCEEKCGDEDRATFESCIAAHGNVYVCRAAAYQVYQQCAQACPPATPQPTSSMKFLKKASKVRSANFSPCEVKCDGESAASFESCVVVGRGDGYVCRAASEKLYQQCMQTCSNA